MDRDEFESKVLEVWTKSRIPLTQANLGYFANVPDRTLEGWIDDLLEEGFFDLDVGEDGALAYSLRSAMRSPDGPDTPAAYVRKRQMVEEAKERILARRAGKSSPPATQREPASALTVAGDSDRGVRGADEGEEEDEDEDEGRGVMRLAGRAAFVASSKALIALDKPLSMMDRPVAKGDKSLLASAGLSLFGPVGWLYAGSFREAIPATLAYIAIGSILPSFLLAPFMLVGSAASALVGLTYAWQFNRKKRRTPLLLSAKSAKKDKKNKRPKKLKE